MATYESRKYAIIPINADQIADGSVSNAEFQTVDTSSSITTQLGTKLPLSGGTITGDTTLTDNQALRIGTGLDLRLLHDGNNSTIQNTTGTLKVLADTVEFKNNADNNTFLSVNSTGSTGDFISGQPSTSSASGSDEILAKISGNIRRISIANAALQGPTGSPGSNGTNGSPGPTGPSGSVTSDTTSVGALRMFVHPSNFTGSGTSADVPHVAGSSYSGTNLRNYTFSAANFSNMNVQPTGSAITGTWLCLGPSGRFRRSGGGDTYYAFWPGLFLRTS